jgi:hypothetical protein
MPLSLMDNTSSKLSDGKRMLMDKNIGSLRMFGEVIGVKMDMLKSWVKTNQLNLTSLL